MGLLDKIKNALFEDDEEKEESHEIAKKIDIAKTIDESNSRDTRESRHEEEPISSLEYNNEEKPKGPIIFDVEDFIEEPVETIAVSPKNRKQEKILYGGYDSNYKEPEKSKEKFHPSPVISPVYGVLDKNYNTEEKSVADRKSIDSLFVDERKKKIDLDTIRQKAYGEKQFVDEPKEESSLLYEMQDKEETPAIGKLTLGDAEEYFEDLGLEYNVDYTDLEKEQKTTRTKKNKELSEVVDEEIKGQDLLDKELITVPKNKSVSDEEDEYDQPEEKSLYDLIDMMYDNK